MKSSKLKEFQLEGATVLSKDQLKNVFGGVADPNDICCVNAKAAFCNDSVQLLSDWVDFWETDGYPTDCFYESSIS